MARTTNEVAELATKVRAALRIERESLRNTNREADKRGAAAIATMLNTFSDTQLCRVFDVITAAESFDLDAYNAAREAQH